MVPILLPPQKHTMTTITEAFKKYSIRATSFNMTLIVVCKNWPINSKVIGKGWGTPLCSHMTCTVQGTQKLKTHKPA
jgi:hypothetical protein